MYKVLIADDEPIVRRGLVGLVDWDSIDCTIVYQAEDGLDAIDKLAIYKPDIVISDIKMPRADGIEVAKYIYQNCPTTKVIILTGYADFSYAKSAIQYKVVDYITKADALEGISKAVILAIEQIEKERSKIPTQGIASLKLNFLKSIIDGSLYDCDIGTGFSDYEIKLGKYIVIAVQFLVTKSFTESDPGKFFRSIANFFNMSFTGFKTYIIPISKDQFCIIIYDLEDNPIHHLEHACENLVDTLESFMRLNVIIGISDLSQSTVTLPIAYRQATYYLNRFFLDQSKKVYSERKEPHTSKSIDIKQFTELVDNITIELQTGKKDTALSFLDEILLLQQNDNIENIKSTGIILVSTCDKLLSNYDCDTKKLLKNENIISIILNCSLLEQFKTLMMDTLSKTADYISTLVQSHNIIIINALKYINDNFSDEITLMDIANHIHINSSYLSRIFKEQTGSTITATINNKKVEKAKELLRNTDKRVYEVAEAVGINDTTYFSHFFKKNTGLSPKEYKDSQKV